MSFQRALVKQKYRLLFTPKQRGKPGPKGPSPELIDAILQMKRRNPRFGYQRIAQQLALAFGVEINKDAVRRVLAKYYRPDPLFDFYRWKANLRILEINEVKTVPNVPISHPFVERLIGTIRRELLDHVPFWTKRDLKRKLFDFAEYYNRERAHRALGGQTPNPLRKPRASLHSIQWQGHCRGLYQLPTAA